VHPLNFVMVQPWLMKSTFIAAQLVAAFAILGGILVNAAPVFATPSQTSGADNATTPGPQMGMGGNMTAMHQGDENQKWGMIASIQNDELGQPAWIVAGYWMMKMAPQNETSTTTSNMTGNIGHVSDFHAMLHMVRLNGSAMHTHEISNFTQDGDATFDSSTNSTTISGTATITMREGPVPDVQTTIKIAQDKVIAITPDPAPLQNHFGDTPIYGIVAPAEMKGQMGMMQGSRMEATTNNNTTTTSPSETSATTMP
jgi:hypothetical protein